MYSVFRAFVTTLGHSELKKKKCINMYEYMIISGCGKVACRLKCAGVTAQSHFERSILKQWSAEELATAITGSQPSNV